MTDVTAERVQATTHYSAHPDSQPPGQVLRDLRPKLAKARMELASIENAARRSLRSYAWPGGDYDANCIQRWKWHCLAADITAAIASLEAELTQPANKPEGTST